MAAAAKPAKPAYELSGWERFKKDVVRDKWLYLLILPGMLFMLIFRYIPIFGNVIAFMDFNPYNMWNSTWVGFDQFIKLFNKPAFMQTFYNTLYISILKMVCGFPIPIILALMMNEMRNMQFKKVAQTLPLSAALHFLGCYGRPHHEFPRSVHGPHHRAPQEHHGQGPAGAYRQDALRPDADYHRHL